MNHWKPNEVPNISPELGFTMNMLFSVMAHDCNCRACTMMKGDAVQALNWLIGDKMDIAEASRLVHGRPEERLLADIFRKRDGEEEAQEEEFVIVPKPVIDACQRAITAHETTDAEKGIIAGWLESLG
jgi:hypothetical protein